MFDEIAKLYQKTTVECELPPAPMFIVHRFFASDADYCQVWRYYARFIRDEHMCMQFWRAILPTLRKAPFLKYAAPKKLKAPEELLQRYMEVMGYNRMQAEEAMEIIELAGEETNLANYLGVEIDA